MICKLSQENDNGQQKAFKNKRKKLLTKPNNYDTVIWLSRERQAKGTLINEQQPSLKIQINIFRANIVNSSNRS